MGVEWAPTLTVLRLRLALSPAPAVEDRSPLRMFTTGSDSAVEDMFSISSGPETNT